MASIRNLEIMRGHSAEVFDASPKSYLELFEDPLFRKLPEAQDLIREESELLASGVSREEINRYSNFYEGIHNLFDDLRHELIWSYQKLGTTQQHERSAALDDIHRERKALEKKEK